MIDNGRYRYSFVVIIEYCFPGSIKKRTIYDDKTEQSNKRFECRNSYGGRFLQSKDMTSKLIRTRG